MSIAHPINLEIRHDIEARLSTIGAKLNIRVLCACESVSRGWGFALLDSD